ncbi:hypothetical protein [Azotobacter chroococcum]|jgi:hypothetical protein|nr:hypothetical protein [Azotobacter chroococcum]
MIDDYMKIIASIVQISTACKVTDDSGLDYLCFGLDSNTLYQLLDT